MSDLISRQTAIDAVDKLSDEPIGYLEAAIDALVDLPSAQPEEDCDTCKHGYFGDDKCNNCRVRYPSHYERRTDESDIHTLSFCPNCGSDMRGEQND